MTRTLGLAMIFLAACGTGAASRVPTEKPITLAALSALGTTPIIDARDALGDVRFLAAPEQQGRGALTRGLGRAGDYIAGRFRAAGLAPGGEDGTYFQAVPVPVGNQLGSGVSFAVDGAALVLGDDFVPNKASSSTRAVGGAVFVGYCIAVPGKYDDFAGVDLRGKLAVCLRHGPHYDRGTGKLGDGTLEDAASLSQKVRAAAQRGAIGVAIVDPLAEGEKPGPIRSLAYHAGAVGKTTATFVLHPAAVERVWLSQLSRPSEQSLAAIEKRIDENNRPDSFALPGQVSFNVQWKKSTVQSHNVVALLEGSDPTLRQQVVLVGAHYDHLGLGDEGSALDGPGQVHPGADDNASGTAAVLEIAEAFAGTTPRPKRSLLFAAFTGEERGLLGSAVLATHPGARKVVAMINLDMVGRMTDDALEIGGAPTSPDWEPAVNAANVDKLKLTFPKRVVPNSDHASFLKKDVPALFLFTGMHGDYHRVSDTWDKVNADGLAKVARLAYRVARGVADRPAALAFVAPNWTRGGTMGAAHGTGVRLGVMPDYQNETGLRISAVLPGGAASAAGLLAGDVIESMGGRTVGDIEAYMEILSTFKPGDQTTVSVRRAGAARAVKVTFAAPPPSSVEDKP
ncbi:MAG TPA: M28 family peptidase [Polyangia bacterium]|nr:M28 family peptidase [Polyangia bacterium]